MKPSERRHYVRMQATCKLTYKFPGAEREFSGESVNISGAGIVFNGSEPVAPGLALEINMPPENTIKLSLHAFAEIIRCTRLAPQCYEIACEIKGLR